MRFGSPRRGVKRGLSVLAVGALALGALVATPLAANAATVDVTDVTFDWAINNESSGGSYFGVCNFPSAGIAGNTGSSRVWSAADGFFKSQDGNTTIVKPTANDGTGEKLVTFASKCLLPDETYVPPAPNPLPPKYTPPPPGRLVQPTSNNPLSYTQARVKIANGTGTVDVAGQDAEIQWTGSFTAAYYGGMTYWSATDPKLTVVDGKGKVTATISGYGADMENPEIWSTLTPREVTLADLSNVTVTAQGIQVQPDYLGVAIPADVAGRNPQVELSDENRSWWGAFPADFQRFQMETGQSSYWFTSAGGPNTIQPRKVAAPLNITYVAPVPVAITTQPAAQSVALGQQATFSVAADGATGYQWQSAAIGADTWADVAGATSATYKVVGTTATTKQYRVVVSGAGGPVTSSSAALAVEVPTPTVTVSKTSGLNPSGEFVTVTGRGFLPNPPATSGTRAPLAGKFTGAYVALAKSVNGAVSNHTNSLSDYTTWAVQQAEIASIGGTGTVIAADGTFTATIKAENFEISDGGVWGIRTYAAGGASYPAFASFTPITFAPPAAAIITTQPTSKSVPAGSSTTFTVVAEKATGYQWQSSANGAEWVDIAGATGATYTLTATATAAQSTYRVVVSGAGGNATSEAVSLTAQSPTIVIPAAPREGGTVTITGSGFRAQEPGIYLGLGPAGLAGFYYGADKMVPGQMVIIAPKYEEGQIEQGRTAKLNADGTFSTTVTVPAWSSATPAYSTYTSKAHGQGFQDPSQNTITAVPYAVTVPKAPVDASAALSGANGADISWTAPVDNGGAAITGYEVTLTPTSGTPVSKTVGADVLATSFAGLTPGATYTASVVAKNVIGASPAATAAQAIAVPAVAPDVPAAPSALAAGSASVTVSWAAPAFDGGSAITGYDVVVTQGGEVVTSASVAGTTTTIGGLARATEYSVTVAAKNAVGTSAASSSTSVTTLATAPDALGAPVVTAASGTSINVQWVAPDNGGSPVMAYVVTVRAGADVVKTVEVGNVVTTTVDGLQNGTNYTATVAAKNAQGLGAASPASTSVRTFSAPSAPAVTATLVGANGITATWPAPADGGAAITGYTAQLSKGGQVVQTTSGAGTSADFGSLTPGAVYTVSVTATNNVGTSSPGVAGTVTVPAVAPSAPGTPALVTGTDGTSVTVSWTGPVADGGSPITGYTVVVVAENEEIVAREVGVDTRSAVFTGLPQGTYRAVVGAENAVSSTPSELSASVELAGAAPQAEPVVVSDSTFVGESGGDAKITIDGKNIEINVGVDRANTWVGVTVHSNPVFLGWFLVDAEGFVRTTLPADLPDGVHHVVVQDADGNVLGYQEFRVGAEPAGQGDAGHKDGVKDALAVTGANVDLLGWSVFASLMLLLGGGVVLIARRKSARV